MPTAWTTGAAKSQDEALSTKRLHTAGMSRHLLAEYRVWLLRCETAVLEKSEKAVLDLCH